MTNGFSFKILYLNQKTTSEQELFFQHGLSIIYGESGVGKSELACLLSGIENNCEHSRFEIINKSIESNVNLVQQNPDQQIIANSILNELAFNLECKYQNSDDIKNELESIINKLLLDVDLLRHPSTLSGGEKELLNIFTTQSLKSKIIILDDALSFLSNNMKIRVVAKLNNCNTPVLWFTSDINDLQYSESKFEMTETSINKLEFIHQFISDKHDINDGEIGLQVSKLNFAYDTNTIFSDLDISIDKFRCLGVFGENGSGKSTLASLLLNIEKPSSGTLKLIYNGESQLDIGFLDQFPERLIGISTINEFLSKLISNNMLQESNMPTIFRDLNELNIDWENISSIPGNRLSWTLLRVALICILVNCKYDILILDEPTFGMGQNQKNNLKSYLIRYLEKKHLILISHDELFLESICDKTIEL